MAKNLYETADDTLRGEAQGQLSPEAQGLWDKYNQVYGGIQNIPMKTMRMRSGAVMPIMDPGAYLKQKALQRVLGGMNQTGLGTRAAPQPGALSQMAPFVTALGSDPKFQKYLAQMFGGGSNYTPSGSYGLEGGSPADFYAADATDNIDWGGAADSFDWSDTIDPDASYWDF